MPPYVPNNINVFSAAFSGAMSAMSSPYGSAVIDPTALDYEPYCLAAMSWAQAVDTVWGAILIPNDVNLQNLRLVSHAYHTTHPIAPHDLAPYSDPTNWAQSAAATVAIALEGDANYAAAGLVPPPFGGGTQRARGVFLGVLPADLTQFVVLNNFFNDSIVYEQGDIVLAIGENAQGGLPERNGPWLLQSVAGGLGTLVRPSWWPNGTTLQTSQIPIEVGSEGFNFSNTRFRAMGRQTAGLVITPTNTFVVGIDDPGMYQEIFTARVYLTEGRYDLYAPTLSERSSISVIDLSIRPATTAYYGVDMIPGDWGIEGGATIFATTAAGDIDTDNEGEILIGLMNQKYIGIE